MSKETSNEVILDAIGSLDKRIVSVDEKIATLKDGFITLSEKVGTMHETVATIQETVSTLQKTVATLPTRAEFEDFKEEILEEIRPIARAVDKDAETLLDHNKRLARLETRHT